MTSAALTPSPQPPLRQRVRQAALWRLGVSPIMQAIRLGANIALAGLLFPEAFGAVALALTVMRGLEMLSETGINLAIVRDNREDERFLNTAWTIQAGRSVLLFLAACAMAWPMAAFYDEPWLLRLIPCVALANLISGFNATSIFTLNRSLIEKPRALLELARAVIGRGTMIVWAIVSPTPWALVGGLVVGAIFKLVCSHTLLPGVRNRFAWDRDAVKSLFAFGSWIFIGTAIAFFAQQIDKLMLGKLEAIAMLGVYTIAVTIARVPVDVMGQLAGHVMYPLFAEYSRGEPDKLADRFIKTRRAVLSAAMPVVLGVVVLAPWFFKWMYDERYADAVWIAPLAAVGAWVMILNAPVNKMLLTLGRTRVLAASGAVKLVASAALAMAGYALAGVAGFVLGLAGAALAEHIVDVWALRRAGINVIAQDLAFSAAMLALALAAPAVDAAAAAASLEPSTAVAAHAATCAALLIGVGCWSVRRNLPLLLVKS